MIPGLTPMFQHVSIALALAPDRATASRHILHDLPPDLIRHFIEKPMDGATAEGALLYQDLLLTAMTLVAWEQGVTMEFTEEEAHTRVTEWLAALATEALRRSGAIVPIDDEELSIFDPRNAEKSWRKA